MEDQVNKFLLSAAVIFSMAFASFAVEIVKDGKATAEIVIPKDANPIVKTAAVEFQNIIAKMSGAKLDIVNEPSGNVKSKVWFGENEMTKKLGLDLKDVKYDGYKIIVKGDDIIAAGVDIEWYKYYGFCDDNLSGTAPKWLKYTGHKLSLIHI